MDGLMMKYFVLKPNGDDAYTKASRIAMHAYAKAIREDNPAMATELIDWASREARTAYAVADATTETRHHLDEMIKTVIWMSGCADFGPGGSAHEGWLKVREKLNAALAFTGS